MRTPVRLSLFALGLAAAFTGAAGLGQLTGPVGPVAAEGAGHGGHQVAAGAETAPVLGGLSSVDRGYTLALDQQSLPAGQPAVLSFRVLDETGQPLTDYALTHTKALHLVVVRRDTQHFQHVHPERDQAGTWSLPLTLPAAGSYKLFADFAPRGSATPVVLSADVQVGGDYSPEPLPAVRPESTGGGYSVTISGALQPGKPSPVRLTIARDGVPVTDLDPYLGAYGHVVALRASDLGYLHVHPEAGPAGPSLDFVVDVPTAGTYRLFLDFQHEGRVRTAPFTVTTGAAPPPGAPAPAPAHEGHSG